MDYAILKNKKAVIWHYLLIISLIVTYLLKFALHAEAGKPEKLVSQEKVVDVQTFRNLSSAIKNLAGKKITLLITNQQKVNNLSIPKNISLKFVGNGLIHGNSNGNLIIYGDIYAPLRKIFEGNGRVSGISTAYPQWFGATGQKDDTLAIQTTINSLKPGGILKLKNGAFISSGNIIIKNEIIIEGNGRITKKANTNSNLFYIKKASNIILRNFKIDGNRNNQTVYGNNLALIYVEACSRVKLTNLDIRNGQGSGIHFFHSTDGIISDNVLVNNHDNGIAVGAANTRDIQIIGNYIDTTAIQNGIFITASPGSSATEDKIYRVEVRNNIIKNAGDTGIELGQNCNDCMVTGNKVFHSRNPNILVRDVNNCIVTRNTVSGNSSKEIYNKAGIAVIPLRLKDYDYKLIISDNSVDTDGFGIDIQTSGVSVLRNKIAGYGLSISGSRGIRTFKKFNTIIGNSIDGFDVGIVIGETSKLDAVSNVQIQNNSIKNVNTGITSWLHQVTNVLVSNNTIANHSGFAIKFDSCIGGDEFIVTNNKITNPAKKYSGLKPQQLN